MCPCNPRWLFMGMLFCWPLFSQAQCPPDEKAPTLSILVLERRPHDPEAFTQGLMFRQGVLYESTGRYGHSSVRRLSLADGKVIRQTKLPRTLFGEGLAEGTQGLWQLTWRSGVALLWDADSLRLMGKTKYAGEGWGLARAGNDLFMSDGSAFIRVLEPSGLEERRRFRVCDGGVEVPWLNELEMVHGLLWANVWRRDEIARIDPRTGTVHSWLDAGALRRMEADSAEALNGIAHDAVSDQTWLTGKWWRHLYRVRVAQ